jgi:tryptophan synthase alpha chain
VTGRIARAFAALRRRGDKALVAYLTAGDPDFRRTEALVLAFDREGVDVIELGVPFSDPLADGPVIQAASQRALSHGATLRRVLSLVTRLRRRVKAPLVLMTYLNPVLSLGLDAFGRAARRAGVDGIIVPDLPPDEGGEVSRAMRRHGIDLVYLLAPTSDARRRRLVCRSSRGFVYYVSLTGVTGVRRDIPKDIRRNIAAAKRVSRLPVCAGFGVSTPEQARQIASAADGVIVGSAIVRAAAENRRMPAPAFAAKYVRPLVRAVHAGRR